jgi:hypothetical protein
VIRPSLVRGEPASTSPAGERLFGETSDKKPMRLVDIKTIGDGLAFLTYQLVRGA